MKLKIRASEGDILTCDECRKDVRAVIEIGEELNYGTATAWVCGPCLKKAVEMIEKQNNE